jgi:hypothetical protein
MHRVPAPPGMLVLAAVLLLAAGACTDSSFLIEPPAPPSPPAEVELPVLGFAGSDKCQSCHTRAYITWKQSGHPYKVRKVENGLAPSFPFTRLPGPPPGSSWNDVLYVIGGYGYKARFVGHDGYFITAGGQNQWDHNTKAWSDYEKDRRVAFTCGACHTTGYSPEGHQDGITGLIGTWKEDGIGCEACHGPGNRHVVAPRTEKLKVDRSTAACATCHNRNGVNMQEITAQNGFLMHRDALHSIRNTPGHRNFQCTDCHEAHAGALFSQERNRKPVTVTCEQCHGEARWSMSVAPLADVKKNQPCTTCHMAPMTVSAVPTKRPWNGDMKTHLVRINTSAGAPQFYGTNNNRSYPYITLGFACLQCHEGKSLQWAEENAKKIHRW